MNMDRKTARAICSEHLKAGDALGWFEALYSRAAGDSSIIPWADLTANPQLVDWHKTTGFSFVGRRCLKIGSGLGDDCQYLDENGAAEVVGFDISPTAIAWAEKRFSGSRAQFVCKDLFALPEEWQARFDFVLESYTLQVLPKALRRDAVPIIAKLLAPRGTLLVICRGRSSADPEGEMPWPLLREELVAFEDAGLACLSFEDYVDNESPPVRRFRAVYRSSK